MRKGTYEIKRSHKRLDITQKSPVGNAEKSALPTGKVIGLFCDFFLFINNEQSNY